MRTVLFLSNAPRIELVRLFEGISPVAQAKNWNIQQLGGVRNVRETNALLKFWKPDGCIIQCSTEPEIFPRNLFRHIPHVFIDRDPALTRTNDLVIMHDSAETGRIAARELLSLGLENFAYARASKDLFWCRERFAAFESALELNGSCCRLASDDIDSERNNSHKRLRHWIKSLPKPIGIFAANDRTAELVISAANELGISMPDDLAIISVDDVDGICENTIPTLTSIRPETAQSGRLAAELLARKLDNPALRGITLNYGHHVITHRQSTRRLRAKDTRISKIMEYIRLNAANPDFSFDNLAKIAGCSLRCAEMHFRDLAAKTILDELHERRVEIAMDLLRKPDLQIANVAFQSGFTSLATFARVFNKIAGCSPRDWRQRNALVQGSHP